MVFDGLVYCMVYMLETGGEFGILVRFAGNSQCLVLGGRFGVHMACAFLAFDLIAGVCFVRLLELQWWLIRGRHV